MFQQPESEKLKALFLLFLEVLMTMFCVYPRELCNGTWKQNRIYDTNILTPRFFVFNYIFFYSIVTFNI